MDAKTMIVVTMEYKVDTVQSGIKKLARKTTTASATPASSDLKNTTSSTHF